VSTDSNFRLSQSTEPQARDSVRKGKIAVAVVIPPGFGESAGSAFLGVGSAPTLGFLYDPSRATEMAMVRGILTQHVFEAVSREMFSGAQGRGLVDRSIAQLDATGASAENAALVQMLRGVQNFYGQQAGGTTNPGLSMPYVAHEEAVTSGDNVTYNGYAHSFAGMAVQFLLFAMANLGIDMLLERQRGLWKRLRSAPVSRLTLLGGKLLSGALISLLTLWVSFAFAMIVFHVRIEGSIAGFVSVSVACALMASTFGLLVAALGNSPASARAITTLGVLMMVMLGGAWVPSFVFPAWLQQATKVVPVRWALDGFDSMTWRGIGLSGAMMPTLVLLGFAGIFAAIAATRFRWEES
jgi:ABC-2 type transport system permease protein